MPFPVDKCLSGRRLGAVSLAAALLGGLGAGLPPPVQAQGSSGPIPLVGAGSAPGYGQEFGSGSPGTGNRSDTASPGTGANTGSGRVSAGDDLPVREVGAPPQPPSRAPLSTDSGTSAGEATTGGGRGTGATAPLGSGIGASSVDPAQSPAIEGGGSGVSGTQGEARALMAAAQATMEHLTNDSGFRDTLRDLLGRARAVMIVPDFYKAGFVIGAAYGNGVLMARRPDGSLSDPAFYRLTAGSLGFQFGLQSNEIVMVIMTDAGLRAVMEDRFKGGATASATFFLIGGGADASTTTNGGQDVYAFSHSVGLFGGAGLEGTAIEPRPVWNESVYGGGVTPSAILLQGVATTPLATSLRQSVPGFR